MLNKLKGRLTPTFGFLGGKAKLVADGEAKVATVPQIKGKKLGITLLGPAEANDGSGVYIAR